MMRVKISIADWTTAKRVAEGLSGDEQVAVKRLMTVAEWQGRRIETLEVERDHALQQIDCVSRKEYREAVDRVLALEVEKDKLDKQLAVAQARVGELEVEREEARVEVQKLYAQTEALYVKVEQVFDRAAMDKLRQAKVSKVVQ